MDPQWGHVTIKMSGHPPFPAQVILNAVPAVRDHDPGVPGADQSVEPLAVAVLGDLQERRLWGGRGPQSAALTAGPPAGLIDVHRALIQHPVLQLAVRASQGV